MGLALYFIFCVVQVGDITLGKLYAIVLRSVGAVSVGTSEMADKTAPILGQLLHFF